MLLDTYGGMPARSDLRDPFFADLDEVFPQGVNWQVADDGLERPDVPSHESNMPNFDEAEAVIDAWENRLDDGAGPRRRRGSRGAARLARRRVRRGCRLRRCRHSTSRQRARRNGARRRGDRRRLRAEAPRNAGAHDDRRPTSSVDASRRRPTRPGDRLGRVGSGARRRALGERRRRRTGLLFVAPWLIGLCALLPHPARRLVRVLVHRLRARRPGRQGDRVRRPGQLAAALHDPDVRHSAWVTVKFAVDLRPDVDVRAPRPGVPADVPPPVGIERVPRPVLPAGDRAVRRRHVRVAGLLQRLDRLAQPDARRDRHRRPGLDQRRRLGPPVAGDHRPVGHRQRDHHLHGGAAQRADRALRGGTHRRRQRRGTSSAM